MLTLFSAVLSNITGPLVEANCQERYVEHFTCMSAKWSWCIVFMNKIDVVDDFEELCAYAVSVKVTVTMVRTDKYVYVLRAFAKYISKTRAFGSRNQPAPSKRLTTKLKDILVWL